MCVQKGWGRVQVRRLYPSPPQSDRSQTHQSETRSFDYCRRGAFAALWYGRYCQMIALQEDLAAPEAHEQELCSSQGIEAALHVASGGRQRRGQILRSFVPARFCDGVHSCTSASQSALAPFSSTRMCVPRLVCSPWFPFLYFVDMQWGLHRLCLGFS